MTVLQVHAIDVRLAESMSEARALQSLLDAAEVMSRVGDRLGRVGWGRVGPQ